MNARRSLGVCPPPVPGPLPCESDPDRWFTRADRTHALQRCLACPARVWCARQALRERASWGMWAGIWIDGRLADVRHYLQAIADPTPPDAPTARAPLPAPRRQRTPVRLASIPAVRGATDVAAQIAARSSGHCEIMAPDCRLTYTALVSRERHADNAALRGAASRYAACASCSLAVAGMQSRLARQLGYIVDLGRDPATVPFYWRQRRWMLLDSAGGAHLAVA